MKKGITIGFIAGFSVAIMLVVYFAFKQSPDTYKPEEVPRLAYYPNTEYVQLMMVRSAWPKTIWSGM